jgi:hypothetical protein
MIQRSLVLLVLGRWARSRDRRESRGSEATSLDFRCFLIVLSGDLLTF